jgi:hypothetical protein
MAKTAEARGNKACSSISPTGSMIDDVFGVYFELVLPVVLAKPRMWRVPVRVFPPVPCPGGAKRKRSICIALLHNIPQIRTQCAMKPHKKAVA